jgi:poly(A) polymerase Pap1
MSLRKINKVQNANTSFFKGHFVTFKEGQIQGVRIYVNNIYISIYFELQPIKYKFELYVHNLEFRDFHKKYLDGSLQVCYSKTMPPKWVMRLPSTNAAIQKFEPNWNQPSEVQKKCKIVKYAHGAITCHLASTL